MKHQHAYCGLCEHIIHYTIDDDGDTTFPRGEWLAHQDYIVTGIGETREKADAWVAAYDFERDPYHITQPKER